MSFVDNNSKENQMLGDEIQAGMEVWVKHPIMGGFAGKVIRICEGGRFVDVEATFFGQSKIVNSNLHTISDFDFDLATALRSETYLASRETGRNYQPDFGAPDMTPRDW
jgi:hypothetical protein